VGGLYSLREKIVRREFIEVAYCAPSKLLPLEIVKAISIPFDCCAIRGCSMLLCPVTLSLWDPCGERSRTTRPMPYALHVTPVLSSNLI
jgi:hypothetical protein